MEEFLKCLNRLGIADRRGRRILFLFRIGRGEPPEKSGVRLWFEPQGRYLRWSCDSPGCQSGVQPLVLREIVYSIAFGGSATTSLADFCPNCGRWHKRFEDSYVLGEVFRAATSMSDLADRLVRSQARPPTA